MTNAELAEQWAELHDAGQRALDSAKFFADRGQYYRRDVELEKANAYANEMATLILEAASEI